MSQGQEPRRSARKRQSSKRSADPSEHSPSRPTLPGLTQELDAVQEATHRRIAAVREKSRDWLPVSQAQAPDPCLLCGRQLPSCSLSRGSPAMGAAAGPTSPAPASIWRSRPAVRTGPATSAASSLFFHLHPPGHVHRLLPPRLLSPLSNLLMVTPHLSSPAATAPPSPRRPLHHPFILRPVLHHFSTPAAPAPQIRRRGLGTPPLQRGLRASPLPRLQTIPPPPRGYRATLMSLRAGSSCRSIPGPKTPMQPSHTLHPPPPLPLHLLQSTSLLPFLCLS